MWCTLGDLAFYKKGPFGSSLTKAMFVPKSNDTYKVYEQKNAIQKDNTLGSYFITKEKYDSLIGFAIQPYDIIVSCAGTIGETYVLPQNSQEGIINQALMLIRLYSREIEQFYLLYFDFILKEEAYKESKGTAIKNIPPFDVLKGFHIPLPPISEQQRILKEIEHWFSLIDIIERGKDDLQTTIKQAKSKILDLAIHGKLVPQDPNDEPASELLKRINPKAEVTCDNGHKWKLPQSWCWAKGRQIFLPMKSTKPHNDEFLYIDIDSIDNKRQIINKIKSIKTANAPSRASRYTQKGDVVFSMVRPYLRNIAKVSVDGCIASTGFYVCSPIEDLNSEYCYYLMISDYVVTGLNQFMKGDNSPSINKSHIDEWLFPLPPFPEQQRIVQKIEKLFSLLDHIKKSLEV
ncbi:restriction endonuclease subunit S [Bacteroides xylanisolvens]|uniref:restriction endonuclease subunit S n=1 Tax=Bacteroides xylanisolvens TaxID=371601 RepID=UPI001FBAB3A5|nr:MULTISPECIES: restriction endonuclease subunit S [Bacteroidales]MCZ2662134.1 restriction endonuclease subunit S [Bacteroides fragilis]UVP22234.1 restriction endonuclease subunit S [Bacteroides xylanisolvens]